MSWCNSLDICRGRDHVQLIKPGLVDARQRPSHLLFPGRRLVSFAQANDPKLSDAERDQQQLDKLSSMEGIDYVMVRKTVEWIAMHGDDGAVLIFMPGAGAALKPI